MIKAHVELKSSSLLKLKKETILVNKQTIYYNTMHAKILTIFKK